MKKTILFSAALMASSSYAADPISFRGVKLGTTLDEMKILRFPDEPDDEGEKRPTMQCEDYTSDDYDGDGAAAKAYRRFGALGVAMCRWKTEQDRNAYVDVGNVSSNDVRYYVYKAPDGERRLYRIAITLSSSNAEGLLVSLTEKFGEPSIEHSELQNRFGAKFPSFTAAWSRDGDTIMLEQRGSNVDEGQLEYSRDEYVADYNGKMRERLGPAKL